MVPAFRPPTVTDVVPAPTEGPAVQALVPVTRYWVTKLATLSAVFVQASAAAVSLVAVTLALVTWEASTCGVLPVAYADQRVPAMLLAPTWNVYGSPGIRPPIVTDLVPEPTDGPACQAPEPSLYWVRNSVSLLAASFQEIVASRAAMAGVPMAGSAGMGTVFTVRYADHRVPLALLAPTWNV